MVTYQQNVHNSSRSNVQSIYIFLFISIIGIFSGVVFFIYSFFFSKNLVSTMGSIFLFIFGLMAGIYAENETRKQEQNKQIH